METPTTPTIDTPPHPETVLATLSEADRLEWRKTGTVPETAPETPPDEPGPDDEPDPSPAVAVTTETPVAPKTPTRLEQRVARLKEDAELYADTIRNLGGTVPELGTRTYAKPQDEIDHLVRYRQDLLARTNTLLRQRPKVSAEPIAPVVAPAPLPTMFPTLEQWQEANPTKDWNDYIGERARHEAAILFAEQQQVQAAAAVTRAYQDRVAEFVTAHPDFQDVIAPIVSIPVEQQTPTHFAIADAIQRSPNGPALTYALGRDQQKLFRQIAGLPAPLALYELGKLDASLSQSVAAPTPTPILKTQAPPPPSTLGARPAEPADPVRGALADGDFRRYSREQNARELTAARKPT